MEESRRKFLTRVAYVTPVILTAVVRPAYACSAYGGKQNNPKPPRGPKARRWASKSWWGD